MPTAKQHDRARLPGRFEDLVQMMPPQAILDDTHLDKTIEMIDDLMIISRHTKGQAHYLETLVQLVQVYESTHHSIDTSDISGIDLLEHLLEENDMNASDLARLLDVHVSMGSKILRGERSLTIDHVKTLADHFKIGPEAFIV